MSQSETILKGILGTTSGLMAVITPAMQHIEFWVRICGGLAFLLVSVATLINLIRPWFKKP